MSVVEAILWVFSWLAFAYFAVYGLCQIALTLVAWKRLAAGRHARTFSPLDEIYSSPFTPPVSILLPAYNEEAGVVGSVHSLLDLRYPRHEVIVVNDGSTDRTIEVLREAFELVPVREALRTRIPTAPVRGAFVSRTHPNLWVLDKENGGKADALNAGINASAHAHFCAIDADAVLEQDSLLRIIVPFVDDPELVVAAGGIVRVVNGAVIESGRMVDFRLPRGHIARFQILEYFRAFLIGRLGFDSINAVLIISGAFGLFKRELVEAVGGYEHGTVGEDAELVARLQRYLRHGGERFRIRFIPNPVCWTEAPSDVKTLSRQRRRWQRGLGETLWRHRSQIFNPRAGAFGLFTLPYFLFFELLGAVIEALGIPVVLVAWLIGALSVTFFVLFLAVSVLLAVVISISALLLEEYADRRYERGPDMARLVVYAVAESVGYTQMTAYFRCMGFVDLLRRRHDWGAMTRRGLEQAPEVPLPEPHARA
ncbi:MAG: glycosyltransferase [Solirubrobacterales bacterium]|nr:glycosyltransferase [Solirubrobacterales bacterium]